MDIPSLILVGLAALAVIAALWVMLGRRKTQPPYTKRPSLLTPGEQRFYRVLLEAVPSGIVIFVKVRLMDVVTVPDEAWLKYGAPASGMHCDFVLVAATTMAPLLVIELDDKSHVRPEAKERDQFKDQALAAAGVPILRVRVAARYDLADLRARIGQAIQALPQCQPIHQSFQLLDAAAFLGRCERLID